jgi:hypothetical protein
MFVLHPRLDFPLRFVWRLLLLTSAALCAHGAYASILVTNFGTDSSSCGSSASPCRSISQAIENATSGETIYVGAGRYGDVSGTGTFTGPGDEHAQPASGQFDYSGCVVCISKAVQIYSLNGPALTVIQANSAANFPNAVLITVDGVTFGSLGHGFSIANGGGNGIVVDLEQSPGTAHGVTVSGNIDMGDSQGFVFDGPPGAAFGGCPPQNQFCPPPNTGVFRFSYNRANGSGTGFSILAKASGCCSAVPVYKLQIVLQDNVAVGAVTGFSVDKGVLINCDGCGDHGTAGNVSIENNFSGSSGVGFSLSTAGLVSQNVSLSNATAGFVITAPAGAFTGNSAISNYGPGVVVEFFTDNGGPPVDFGKFSGNNLYGNDRNRQPAAVASSLRTLVPNSFNPGPSAHCGVLNLGGIAQAEQTDIPPQLPAPPFQVTTVEVAEAFWGSSKGPQTSGPGDTIGGACDQNGGATTASKPFLTSPVAIPAAPAL